MRLLSDGQIDSAREWMAERLAERAIAIMKDIDGDGQEDQQDDGSDN